MEQTARWACITRLTREELNELHAIEKKYSATPESSENRYNPYRAGWLAGMWFMDKKNEALGPFWPHRTPEEHKSSEMTRFERKIFPIWKPLADKRMRCEINDMQFVHQVDIRVFSLHFQFRKYSESSGHSLTRKWAKKEPTPTGIENAVKED